MQYRHLHKDINTGDDAATWSKNLVNWTCSLGAEVSQDPLDRFSQSLHHMVGIEWQMISAAFLFTARRLAKRGICRRRVSVCVCVCVSVCVCVCHTPVLYQNG